jgi:hypothetical protein
LTLLKPLPRLLRKVDQKCSTGGACSWTEPAVEVTAGQWERENEKCEKTKRKVRTLNKDLKTKNIRLRAVSLLARSNKPNQKTF